jgi:hypothetical protein
MMRARALVPVVLAVACAFGASRPAGAGPEIWFEYEITPAADLSTLTVSMTFHGEGAKRLVLDDGQGAPWITAAPGGPALVPSPAGGYVPAGESCVYGVDLAKMTGKEGGAYRVGRDLVTRVGRWLLRPAVVPEGTHGTARFVLPERTSVATPWLPAATAGGGYVLDPSTFRYWGWVAFGRFTPRRVTVADTVIEVARLDGALAATDAGIDRWLTTAVRTVAGLYGGRYPRRGVTVFVEPSRATRGEGDPVSFGSTWPGGGAHLILRLPADTPDARLPGEWVAIHELVHLAMPVIPETDAWFSEGIATYYQEVLRMRAGHFSERDGWQSLLDGLAFGRARPAGTTLLDASRTMHETHAYSWTYWAGAAVMLQVDATLRARSAGAAGLDDAMRRWARLAGDERSFDAQGLSADAEALVGTPGLVALAQPALASKEFPDVTPVLAALGIVVRDGKVALDDAAPAAAARRSIAAGGAPAAPPAAPGGAEIPR